MLEWTVHFKLLPCNNKKVNCMHKIKLFSGIRAEAVNDQALHLHKHFQEYFTKEFSKVMQDMPRWLRSLMPSLFVLLAGLCWLFE